MPSVLTGSPCHPDSICIAVYAFARCRDASLLSAFLSALAAERSALAGDLYIAMRCCSGNFCQQTHKVSEHFARRADTRKNVLPGLYKA